MFSSHKSTLSFALFPLPLWTCAAMQPSCLRWRRSLFSGDIMIQLNGTLVNSSGWQILPGRCGDPQVLLGLNVGLLSVPVPLSGSTREPGRRGGKIKAAHSCPVVFDGAKTSVRWWLLSWKVFQNKYTYTSTWARSAGDTRDAIPRSCFQPCHIV